MAKPRKVAMGMTHDHQFEGGDPTGFSTGAEMLIPPISQSSNSFFYSTT